MALLIWFTMGLSIWHFSVFVPDRFWGGIVGALLGSIFGAMVVGIAIHLAQSKAMNDVDIVTVFPGILGALLGLAAIYMIGIKKAEIS